MKIPDEDAATLHIRCGTDIRGTLTAAGFAGAFLEYSDPVCQGPVPDAGDLVRQRAAFLSNAYDVGRDDVLEKLVAAEAALGAAATRYKRVVLWFEHDTYDQLVLARTLSRFSVDGVPRVLEMVTTDRFPGIDRFTGLGQLSPENLRDLWPQRIAVSEKQLKTGRRVWDALRATDPIALHERIYDCAALPYMARALRRHLEELPGVDDGLGLTERLILQILRDGDRSAGQIFRDLMMVREPLPWLGDTMFWYVLRSMMRAETCPFDIANHNAGWPERLFSLNEAGRELLAGRRDWMSFMPPPRWLGGIRIEAGKPCWHWDGKAERPVLP